MTSPITMSRAGMTTSSPSRRAVAVGAAIWRSASGLARSDILAETQQRSKEDDECNCDGLRVVAQKNESAVATNKMAIRTFLNCPRRMLQGEIR